MTIIALGIFIGSTGLSTLLTYAVRRWALKTDFVSRPSADRFHQAVIPLGGGIAIFWTIAIALIGAMVFVKFIVAPGHAAWLGESITTHVTGFNTKIAGLMIVLACALVLHILGLVDDKKHLGPFVKLAVQFAVAIAAATLADIRVEFFIENKIVTTSLSVLWIVFIMNAFNFLDNMDGLSAGIAAITSTALFTAAAMSGQVFVAATALIFIGALTGFLVFNFPPAKIFMGDCGSLVIGFFVALLTLKTTYYHQHISGGLYAVFMPLVVMAVPLYDFVSVTLIRLAQGKSPFVGDTQHFSHRIKRRGLTDTQTTLTLYLATVCTCISSVFLFKADLLWAILIFTQVVMILAIIAILEMAGSGLSNKG